MRKNDNLFLILATISVYVLCNFFMIASPGVWWDDWTIYNADPNDVWNQFVIEGGQPVSGRFHYWALNTIKSEFIPLIYHWLSFFLGGISLLATWHILKRFDLSKYNFGVLMLLIASSPLCSARITMACMFYPLSGTLFMLGVWSFLNYIEKNLLVYRLLAFGAFMIGLCVWLTSAVLVPIFILLMAIYVRKEKFCLRRDYLKVIMICLGRWWEFTLIPVFILILRKLFFTPVGPYSSYHVTLEEWLRLPLQMIYSFYGCTVGYAQSLLRINYNDIVFLIVVLIIVLACIFLTNIFYLKYSRTAAGNPSIHLNRLHLFMIAIILFFAAVMPSSTMSSASMGEYTSRYYVLALVPFAIIMHLLLSYLKRPLNILALGILLGVNIIININDQLLFQKQWVKNEAIAEYFRKAQLNEYVNVLFVDNSQSLNAYHSCYRYYEYSGIYKEIWPDDQTHFMTDSKAGIPKFHQDSILYNCKKAVNIDIIKEKITLDLLKDVTLSDMLYLLYSYYFDFETFSNSCYKHLSIKSDTL